jgi:hypothetical protein
VTNIKAPFPDAMPTMVHAQPIDDASVKQRDWVARFNNISTTAELEDILLQLEQEVKIANRIAEPRPHRANHQRRQPQMPNRRRQQQQYDPNAASRIQKLYRQCRPRAFREVTEAESPFCQIPAEELHEHYSRVFVLGPTIPEDELPLEVPRYEELKDEDRNPFAAMFTAMEVWKRLRRYSNTTPGPDGIRYFAWKKFDICAYILSSIFNCVNRIGHIPQSWTKSTTILLHKKGDKDDVSNWRPISMSNTIAKVYSSVLVERLANWATRNQRISESQKGFMPIDGCAEHNFVLQSIIADSRRNRQQCCIAWLDLTNAFGSVPHSTIFKSLEWAGLNDEAIQVVSRLYNNNTTIIRSSIGPTPSITINAGVKQGCPLSPIIFNLAIEPILRAVSRPNVGYQLCNQKIDSLAYADDLALIAKTPAELQQLMNITGRIAAWTGLQFNARKCATLHIDGRRKEEIHTSFEIQEGNPVILAEGDMYEHLGVPTGYHVSHTTNSDDRLPGSEQRWPVLNSLVFLGKGLVTLSRESEREREGG